jgi:hypothetical protein
VQADWLSLQVLDQSTLLHAYKASKQAHKTVTFKALDLFSLSFSFSLSLSLSLSLFLFLSLSLLHPMWQEGTIVHDKMIRLGEVRILIMLVSCDMSRKILWTIHITHACIQRLATAASLQPCTHAMERHITESL